MAYSTTWKHPCPTFRSLRWRWSHLLTICFNYTVMIKWRSIFNQCVTLSISSLICAWLLGIMQRYSYLRSHCDNLAVQFFCFSLRNLMNSLSIYVVKFHLLLLNYQAVLHLISNIKISFWNSCNVWGIPSIMCSVRLGFVFNIMS